MNILITGGAGYIGSVLTPLLLQNDYKVTVIDNLMYKQNSLLDCFSFKNFTFIKSDVCNFDEINSLIPKFDIIIPLAAIVGAPACKINPALSKLINEDSNLNLVKNISKNQQIIFPTTNSGYGIGEKNKYCDENSPLNPLSDYAKSKVKIEKLFLDNSNATSLRLATVFGVSPRMRLDLLVNDFVFKAMKDNYLVLFEENFRRNYIHVFDVSNAFKFTLENIKNMSGQIYNVGLSSANLTKLQLANKIKEHIPSLSIHSAKIGSDPDKRDYLVSNEKIEKIGWSAINNLDDGIQEIINSYEIIKMKANSNV